MLRTARRRPVYDARLSAPLEEQPGHRKPKMDFNRVLRRVRPAPLARVIHGVLGIRRRVVNTPVGPMFLDPVFGIGGSIAKTGSFEPEMERTLAKELCHGMTFVDLGANEGYFTIQGARLVGSTGRVVAVEPQSRLIPILERNLTLNDLSNVTVVQAAISDFKGLSTLYLPPEPAAASFTRMARYPVPTQQVPTITVAGLFAQCGIANADVMKVDIEGAEYEAVLGSRIIFNAHRVKVLALDLHLAQLGNARTNELIAFVEGCGYCRDMRYMNTVWRAPANPRIGQHRTTG
jgi:FkbM family methyltransferase